MKISLNWLLEHLEHNLGKSFDNMLNFANDFAKKFNTSIGEMESFQHIKLKHDLFLGEFIKTENCFTEFKVNDKNIKIETDLKRNAWLINDNNWRIANYHDINSLKEDILPEPNIEDQAIIKENFEDIIFEIENKSLTHRADLWSHYGIAREISALYNWKLKEIKLDKLSVANDNKSGQISVKLDEKNKNFCPRLAVCQIDNIIINPSPFWLLMRLAIVGSRSINLTVDLTNFVMLDIGNPMHAFDRKSFAENIIEPKMACDGQKLKLLDEKTIELNHQDLVISDGANPLALAGVMGGNESGVNFKTTSIVIEAAVFDPGVIRKSSVRHKTRTEASTRFEKGLDLSGNITAIKLFITYLKKYLPEINVHNIVSIGNLPSNQKIKIDLIDFKKKLSIKINNEQIIEILKKLNFIVEQNGEHLEIIVPLSRGSREFIYEADIIEEIGRFIGFDKVQSSIPKLALKGWDLDKHLRFRNLKDFCAYGGSMNEVSNYPLYDEIWLNELKYQEELNLKIINPVSEFRYRPVSTLIMHLVQNIYNNRLEKSLKFFELAPVWCLINKKPVESKKLAVAWFGDEDFYDFKNFWLELFNSLDLKISWQEGKHNLFKTNSTAKLMIGEKVLGFVGYAAPFIEAKITKPILIAELDAEILVGDFKNTKIKPLNKYPISKLDVSFFATNKSVSELETIIAKAHELITEVELIDTMEKSEWNGKKSYTFRYIVASHDKNLIKDDLQNTLDCVQKKLIEIGAEIR